MMLGKLVYTIVDFAWENLWNAAMNWDLIIFSSNFLNIEDLSL